MDFNKVNYEVLEEALLAAESKEQIHSIFTAIANNSLDSEILCLSSDNLPLSLRTLPKTLNISNDKAVTVCILLYLTLT